MHESPPLARAIRPPVEQVLDGYDPATDVAGDASPYPPTAYGAFQRLRTWLFGPQQHRLAEEQGEIHPLSYLLIAAQSLTVLFVFAHQQIVQMLTAPWTIKVIAGLVSFVLVITVIAADMCVAYSWRRIPPLRRNREDGMVWEHWLYILFVLALEGTTFAVVIATLEGSPDALLSARPVIDAGTWLWRAMVAARLVTVGWTTLQLLIVKSKVPVQWTTLMGTGAEVLGGHAQHLMQNLNVQGHDLARVVRAYAALTKPRRRFPTAWNRAKVAKEAWHEQRENEQREEVLAALREFEPRPRVVEVTAAPTMTVRTPALEPPSRPPTGPGSPAARPRERLERANGSSSGSMGTEGTDKVVQLPTVRTPRRDAPGETPAATRTHAKGRASAKANKAKGPTQAERVAAIRERRLTWMEEQLASDPTIATRELVRRLRTAEHNRSISESTVSELRHVVEARQDAQATGSMEGVAK